MPCAAMTNVGVGGGWRDEVSAGSDGVLDSALMIVSIIESSAVGLPCGGGPPWGISVMCTFSLLCATSPISTSSFNPETLDSPSGRDTSSSASSLTSAMATSSGSTGPWDR